MQGALDDTPAGRDFAAILPPGTTPAAGDISYYAPWGNLALFNRDFSYSPGLVRLGRLDPSGTELLASLTDDTTITITTPGGTP